jgi:hypothetical protein
VRVLGLAIKTAFYRAQLLVVPRGNGAQEQAQYGLAEATVNTGIVRLGITCKTVTYPGNGWAVSRRQLPACIGHDDFGADLAGPEPPEMAEST